MRRILPLLGMLAGSLPAFAQQPPAPHPTISWSKTIVDDKFRSEGIAAADVNKDGKKDLIVGEFWYEGPDFKKRHEMQTPGTYDGMKGYSHSFAVWAEDLNGDGYPDAIVIDFPGDACYWLENPKGKGTNADGSPTHWKKHILWHSACNETPLYQDLLGTGRRVLIMGFQPKGKGNGKSGQMAYFTPKAGDAYALWEMHPISGPSTKDAEIAGTQKFSHGLGVGDINGDGRRDVMTSGATTDGTAGWWEQPAKPDGATPWTFHPFQFKDACADMFATDLDGDGKADILCTSAHQFGIWALKQRPAKSADGHPAFEKSVLYPNLISETHAAHFVDIDGDGLKDFITGKRWLSHGRAEPGSDKAPAVYWFQAKKATDGAITFTPHVIDPDCGIGTQFEMTDVDGDGLLDLVVSNKKGVSVVFQKRGK